MPLPSSTYLLRAEARRSRAGWRVNGGEGDAGALKTNLSESQFLLPQDPGSQNRPPLAPRPLIT